MPTAQPTVSKLRLPIPYFGGKSTVAQEVWNRFGDAPNFVEPFCGTAAILLARPDEHDWVQRIETINDANGYVANFFRAIQADAEGVANYAAWQVNENDLHARHAWLVGRKKSMQSRLEGDPDWFDVKIAGWWAWGMASWIGGGFCTGEGPWSVQEIDGQKHLVRGDDGSSTGLGISRRRIQINHFGQGIHGKSLRRIDNAIRSYLERLADRLYHVRVCCGDWTRVCGPTPTLQCGLTAIFFDPPYDQSMRDSKLYGVESNISASVHRWCLEHGDDHRYRIALCGYADEHAMPDSWECFAWKTQGGLANQGMNNRGRENKSQERIWFSPGCLKP